MNQASTVKSNRVAKARDLTLDRLQAINGRLQRRVVLEETKKEVVKGDLVLPQLEPFFKWVNGETDPKKHNFFSLRDITKAIWPLYLPLQVIGLVNEKAAKLARAWYGACWSIVYSCYRPWKEGRDQLIDKDPNNPISAGAKKLYNANEYFRVGMGTIVSAIYGSGAFGMLWGALTGNDDLYDKSSGVYETGMFNQNQIFASMNAADLLKRKYNENQLQEAHKRKNDTKSNVELVDTILFIPNIFTRTLATFGMFGINVNEGLKRIVHSLGYFSYGTWATRYGLVKNLEKEGGDLKPVSENLNGIPAKVDKILHDTQSSSASIFSTLLPGLSWTAATLELCGFRDFAEKAFKLEGICERLNPAIASWSIRDTWIKLFSRKQRYNVTDL